MKTKPSLWEQTRGSQPERLYITIIELESPDNVGRDCRPLALLTRTRLPDFPPFILHVQIGRTSSVLCTSLSQYFGISQTQLHEVTEFTLRIYEDIYNKTFEHNESEMTYWLAPVIEDWKHEAPRQNPEQLLDWDMITYICNNADIPWSVDTPQDQLIGRYLIDRWDGGKRFFSTAMEPSLKPGDPVPADAAPSKRMDKIIEYTVSLFARSRARVVWRDDQPVIRAEKILHRLNLLDEHTEKEKGVPTRAYLCPEPLKFSALPIGIVSMGYLFSAIVHRLDSYLISMEAFSIFGLSVKPDLALEAMTKDSDNTEEHRAEQLHLQRGMGKNYERLEFLGDCFLKLATSITLYTTNPDDNEFEYHVRRMLMICNSNLLKTAQDAKLYEYIRSRAFSRLVDHYTIGILGYLLLQAPLVSPRHQASQGQRPYEGRQRSPNTPPRR